MGNDVLVLWDIDGTLLNAGGVGRDLYDTVFAHLFGRSLEAHLPMAGRTDRAIILEALALAGVDEPRRYVDPFIAGLSARVPAVRDIVAARGRALPGAAAALSAVAALGTLAPAASATSGTSTASATSGTSTASGRSLAAPGVPDTTGIAAVPRVHQSVLTGNIRALAEVKLAALGLRDPLDLRIGAYGDDHEDRAELVQVARRRAVVVHGRPPSAFDGLATVVVGDTPLDIAAALETGARAVGVATGPYSAAELAATGAAAVLPDLTDINAVLRTLQVGPQRFSSPA